MLHIPPATEAEEKAREAFYAKIPPVPEGGKKPRSARPIHEEASIGTAYMVTVNGPGWTESVVIVEASKSSQARRAAKKELKAAGTDITNLSFSACRL